MEQTRLVSTTTQGEQEITEIFQLFGWTLKKREDYFYDEKRDGNSSLLKWNYSGTNKTAMNWDLSSNAHVKLTFEINDQDPSYNPRKMELFEEYLTANETYNREMNSIDSKQGGGSIGGFVVPIIIGFLMIMGGIALAAGSGGNNNPGGVGGGIGLALTGLLLAVIFCSVGGSYKTRNNKENTLAKRRSSPILMKTQSQIDSIISELTALDSPKKKTECEQPIRKEEDSKKLTEDTTAQLIQYKKLLDAGVITQEEFDAKKKELL